MNHKSVELSKILKTKVNIKLQSCISPIHHHAFFRAPHYELIDPLFAGKLSLCYNLESILVCITIPFLFLEKHYNSIILPCKDCLPKDA